MNLRIIIVSLSLLFSPLIQSMIPENNYPKESVAVSDNVFLSTDFELIDPNGTGYIPADDENRKNVVCSEIVISRSENQKNNLNGVFYDEFTKIRDNLYYVVTIFNTDNGTD